MSNTLTVKRFPRDPGPAAWDCILSAAPRYPELDEVLEADWVIVGAGFAGLAAARRLSQLVPSDQSIVLLEARRLAEGPAGRNSGFMIDLPHELNSETYAGSADSDCKQIKLNRAAIKFVATMADEFELSRDVFNPCGRITGAATERGIKHVNSYTKHLEGLGEPFQLLGASDLKDITGTEFYRQGFFTPGAAMIQPAAYVREVARHLSPRVRIFENSPVVAIEQGERHKVRTPGGSVSARKVILAVNGHIQSFGYFPRRLLHVFTYSSMTRALTQAECRKLGGRDDWGILPADPMGTTVRRIRDYQGSGHRLIIRNHFTLNQGMEVTEKQLRQASGMHDQSFATRFPILRDVPMEYRWGGRLCLSWNSMPAFGEVDERIYAASCQNGLGTVKGTLSGMMAAELAVLGRSAMLDDFMAHSAPKQLPPEPFLSVGANLTIRLKEWQAGKEL